MTFCVAIQVEEGVAALADTRIVRGDEENPVEIEASEATPIKPGDIIEVPERFF